MAHQFKDTIDECQKELRERNAATTEKGGKSLKQLMCSILNLNPLSRHILVLKCRLSVDTFVLKCQDQLIIVSCLAVNF